MPPENDPSMRTAGQLNSLDKLSEISLESLPYATTPMPNGPRHYVDTTVNVPPPPNVTVTIPPFHSSGFVRYWTMAATLLIVTAWSDALQLGLPSLDGAWGLIIIFAAFAVGVTVIGHLGCWWASYARLGGQPYAELPTCRSCVSLLSASLGVAAGWAWVNFFRIFQEVVFADTPDRGVTFAVLTAVFFSMLFTILSILLSAVAEQAGFRNVRTTQTRLFGTVSFKWPAAQQVQVPPSAKDFRTKQQYILLSTALITFAAGTWWIVYLAAFRFITIRVSSILVAKVIVALIALALTLALVFGVALVIVGKPSADSIHGAHAFEIRKAQGILIILACAIFAGFVVADVAWTLLVRFTARLSIFNVIFAILYAMLVIVFSLSMGSYLRSYSFRTVALQSLRVYGICLFAVLTAAAWSQLGRSIYLAILQRTGKTITATFFVFAPIATLVGLAALALIFFQRSPRPPRTNRVRPLTPPPPPPPPPPAYHP